MSRTISPVILVSAVSFAGCFYEGGGGAWDGGIDGGSDTESGSETEPDTDTATWVSDLGSWEWEDNPPGEDCGTGCRQLTFTDEVKPFYWDVWGDYLVYRPDGSEAEDRDHLYLVDIPNDRRMKIGIPYDLEWYESAALLYPCLYEDRIYYSLSTFDGSAVARQLVRVDFEDGIQTIVHSQDYSDEFFNKFLGMKYLDCYEDLIVTQAGCGTEATNGYSLCLFDASTVPAVVHTLIDDDYGNVNSMWEDVLTFTDSREGYDVNGYDIAAEELFPVAADPEFSEIGGRVYKRKVVYGDLRFGTNQDAFFGDFNHETLFLYDLDTHERVQITNAEWIHDSPDIWEEIVVWLDYRAAAQPNEIWHFYNVQIWGKNLETDQEFQITNLPEYADPTRPKASPRIWGYKVFVDMTTIDPDTFNAIYMFDLPEGARQRAPSPGKLD